MTDIPSTIPAVSKNVPWNKGKIVGAKPPLRPKHVWSIRTKLQVEGRMRDLALFNVAIDSKLRGCDVVALKVDDLAPGGYAADRARPTKEDRPASQIRTHGIDPAGNRRLPAAYWQEVRRILVHWPAAEWAYDDPPVRPTPISLDR